MNYTEFYYGPEGIMDDRRDRGNGCDECRDENWQNMNAVSYTHLDVYKRQLQESVMPSSRTTCIMIRTAETQNRRNMSLNIEVFGTVLILSKSYSPNFSPSFFGALIKIPPRSI